ncbi:MAG: ABC transporter substrate-binding protein [Rhodospirillaceae bacterium]
MIFTIHARLLAVVLFCALYPLALGAQEPLRVGVVAFPASDGDPHRSVSVFSTYTWSPTFETLTTFQEDGTLVGELAKSWQQITPTTWHFELRSDAAFSNGRPFTAADVVSSLDYLKTPHGQTSSVARDLDIIAGAQTLDAYTLAVTTSAPTAILPRLLAALYIVEPDHWETLGPDAFARDPIGSGPFAITAWRQGRVSYETNPYSWRKPEIEKMEVLHLPESTSRLQAIVTGGIDIAIGMGPDDIPLIERAGGYMHQRNPIDVISIAFVVQDGRPANDIRVRRALNYAVNKNAITEILLSGMSQPATQGAVRGLLGYDPTLEAYPYDPDRARALLKEAGYEGGFKLDIEVIIGSNASDSAIYQLVAANLADVGVTLNIISIPTSQMVRIILQGQWKGDGFSQVFGGWPTFEPLRTLRLHSCLWPSPWYCDERIMPTMKAALETPHLEERIRLTRDVLGFYHDQATALMLHEIPLLDGVGPRVTGYAPNKGKINYETITFADDT